MVMPCKSLKLHSLATLNSSFVNFFSFLGALKHLKYNTQSIKIPSYLDVIWLSFLDQNMKPRVKGINNLASTSLSACLLLPKPLSKHFSQALQNQHK